MAGKRNPFSNVWSGIGHALRALGLYHLIVPLAVAALTFIKGVMEGFALAVLIPLTVIAAGGTLYVINQIIILYNRAREGYAYGLAYEGIVLGLHSAGTPNAMLQLSVLIRNATERPLRYEVEQFDVVIDDLSQIQCSLGQALLFREMRYVDIFIRRLDEAR